MDDYAALARAGDLDALFGIADMLSKADRLAYKWLCAARDFGHEDADDMIEDIMEVTSMRYDDSGFEAKAAHWELAVAYLTGDEGLPVDTRLAQEHLEVAFASGFLDAINAATGERYEAETVLARLEGEPKRVLEFELEGGDLYRRVEVIIGRIEHLRTCSAPTIYVDEEIERLNDAMDTLEGNAERAKQLASLEGRSLDALEARVRRVIAG